MPPSVTDIKVCVWQWYTLSHLQYLVSSILQYLETMIVYDGQCMCLIAVPGVRMAGCGRLACVGFVPATVLVCQNALWLCAWLYPMTAPFHHTGCYCSFAGVRSFLSTFWMSKNKILCFCECTVPFISPKLVDHVSILLHWCFNKTVFNCICGARIVPITRQAQTSES